MIYADRRYNCMRFKAREEGAVRTRRKFCLWPLEAEGVYYWLEWVTLKECLYYDYGIGRRPGWKWEVLELNRKVL